MRLKVLLSAYACEPEKGSEPAVGWNWALQMARFHEVTVLTRKNNQKCIEKALQKLPESLRPRFIYHDEGRFLLKLKRDFRLHTLYYLLWQKNARQVIAKEIQAHQYDLIHHVTFASYRWPTAVWGHGLPVVWGPIGGMKTIPHHLFRSSNATFYLGVVFRWVDNLFQGWPFYLARSRGKASARVLVSHRECGQVFNDFGIDTILRPTIGIKRDQISNRVISDPKGPLKLLFVGRIMAVKGIELAMEALALSGSDATLTFVGGGGSQFRNLVTKYGLEGRVTFKGSLDHDDVYKTCLEHHVFIFPSVYDSGGFSVIEAMGQGLPVICLKCGGPEVSVSDNCGVRVKVGDRADVVRGLAEAINFYDRDREKVVQHGNAARLRILDKYEWNQQGDFLNEIYRQLFQGGKS